LSLLHIFARVNA